MSVKRVRGLVALAAFVVIGVGLAVHTGTGTLSSFGWRWVSTICPLGALEALLGSWAFVPRLVFALLAIVVVCVLVGRAFCSWVCPIPHIKSLFKSKRRKREEAAERADAGQRALERYRQRRGTPREGEQTPYKPDGRHVVLGATLVSAAVFGFPVFCLVCPIGLTVGEFVLFWRFVQYNEATWALLLFPAIVILEVVVFKRWCGSICPLGALLSLCGAVNRTFRPTVDHDVCLRDTQGTGCHACESACPEFVDPHSNLGDRPLAECVRCGSCKVACPVEAITFPLLARKAAPKAPAPVGEEQAG